MEINILIEDEFKGKVTKSWLSTVAEKVLAGERTGDNVELGVLITTQEKVQELNWTYRNKNEPTDVLSFFMIPEKAERGGDSTDIFVMPPGNIRHLGEVIISYPQAKEQATEHKHTVKEEIAVLIIHGILHLLGHDHEKPGDEKIMRARESAILKTI